MFWGKKHDEAEAQPADAAEQLKVIPRGKLPPQLQQMVDQDDGLYDDLYSS
ncbi:uncharacterized protein ACLA_054350 [Aspergillus clavatus NRRL 1]|uniref:Uncharacterized protein n=1 Tax=Aspergillus clavatus (strain ATCC 1007 / CBS 513.65 / DSM 816 / NCTC 3887 / NRRL 1 / QM 1276 / 107) TaxID=344612 RepID=A1C964_ASPCL|nr:uncharacterized protein ACLA_054350 [Aspergillus clavatus NRRL 1]EAW13388.1 hypothetical protein ACLA_054350 [Aspergillus clavatus NRRL 1]